MGTKKGVYNIFHSEKKNLIGKIDSGIIEISYLR